MQGEVGYEAPEQHFPEAEGEGAEGRLSRDLQEMKEMMGGLSVSEGKARVFNGQWPDRKDPNDGSYMVRLRGLPWEATEEDVKEFFKKAEVTAEDIFIGSQKGRATGEAFAKFSSEEGRASALALSGQHIGSRYIEMFAGTLKEREAAQFKAGRPVPLTEAEQAMKFIRLRGLPFSAKEQDVRTFFGELPIGVVHLISDLGWATGEAFVELSTAETAEEALKLHKKTLGARYIEVFSSSRAEMDSRRQRSPNAGAAPVNPGAFVVRLRGFPFSATEAQIREFLHGIQAGSVHMTTDFDGRPSGEAFVELSSEEAVAAALKLDKAMMGPRYVEIFRSSPEETWGALTKWAIRHPISLFPRPTPTLPSAALQNFGFARPPQFGFPGWEQQFNMGRRRTLSFPTQSHALKMRGIPYSATDQQIHQFFLDARAHPLRVHRQYGGGEAYVEFASQQEAQHAFSLHKCYMGQRYIELIMVTPEELMQVVSPHSYNQQHPLAAPQPTFPYPYSDARVRNQTTYGLPSGGALSYGADSRIYGARDAYRGYGGSGEYRR
jgi:RNA recognition motif-containing protein